MGIKQTLDVINAMEAAGVVGRYAIAGAVAAFNYIEPAVTKDLDLLVSLDKAKGSPSSGLISLGPIIEHLKNLGYSEFTDGGVVVAGWPIQFLPVSDDLDAEALQSAETIDLKTSDGLVKTRVLRAEHLVAISLRVGRPKDINRIVDFLEGGAVDLTRLAGVLERHRLGDAWIRFCSRTGMKDVLHLS